MNAKVTYPYRDRFTGEVRYSGDVVELDGDRFRELSLKGFVAALEPAQAEPEQAAAAPETAAEQAAGAGEMTTAQLRAAIEAKGGFAPKKATKAQLSAILGTL